MDTRTRNALEGSIAKWQAIVDGTGTDESSHNCPLCQLFMRNPECDGCPVAAESGVDSCEGTPYYDYVNSWNLPTSDRKPFAQAELDFLISLRPTDV